MATKQRKKHLTTQKDEMCKKKKNPKKTPDFFEYIIYKTK